MSTVDDKLKTWRDSTELEPSPELLARLEAQLAPEPTPSSLATGVKVLIAVVVVGVSALFAFRQRTTAVVFVPHPQATMMPRVADAGAVRCPPRPSAVPVMLVAAPAPSVAEAKRARAQLTSRPLTCEGQLSALDLLMSSPLTTPDERVSLRVRRVFLCGGDGLINSPEVVPNPHWLTEPCDDSSWCRAPRCDLRETACLEATAVLPETSCDGKLARMVLRERFCTSFIRGEGLPDAGQSDAWCLAPAAVKELESLKARNAVPGTLPGH